MYPMALKMTVLIHNSYYVAMPGKLNEGPYI